MNIHKIVLQKICIVLLSTSLFAQQKDTLQQSNNLIDELESLLDDNNSNEKSNITGAFKTTRIANGHSIENLQTGTLDFRVNHRFGAVNNGFSDFFGLDNAVTRIGVDYGAADWMMLGIGRSTYLQEFDGYLKLKIINQKNDNSIPVSLNYVGAISQLKNDFTLPNGEKFPKINRWSFMNQVLIARKFNSNFSLQLTPTHIHYNMVEKSSDPNDILALGIGTRIKLNKRLSLSGEYYYQLPNNQLTNSKNALTIGLDIETGGHVFQLLFSNSSFITERNVIGLTNGSWGKGDIHFGFNISRMFTVVKPKEFQNSRNKIW